MKSTCRWKTLPGAGGMPGIRGEGDMLMLKLGYQGEALLDCRSFSIDEIELGAPPDTVSIRGVATSVNSALRTASSEGYEETTLDAIASRIAQKHGLKLVGQIEPITIDRVTQYAETRRRLSEATGG